MQKEVSIVVIIVFLMIVPSLYAADFSYDANMTQLPLVTAQSVAISLPNGTNLSHSNLTIDYSQFLSGVTNLTLNSYNYTHVVYINVPRDTPPKSYLSYANFSFNDSNATIKTSFSFEFNVINNTPNLSSLDTTPFFYINMNTYGYDICDYQIKKEPLQKYFYSTITVNPRSTLRIICTEGNYASCPGQIYSESAVYLLNLSIQIPVNASLGLHEDKINIYQDSFVNINNVSVPVTNPLVENLTLQYNINYCPIPSTYFESCTFICNSTNVDEYLVCKQKQMQCEIDIYNALIEANRTREINTTIEHNTTIEVPVLAYSPNMTALFRESYEKDKNINRLLVDNKAQTEQIAQLQAEKDRILAAQFDLQNNLPMMVKESVQELMRKNQNITYELEHLKKNSIPFWWLGIGAVILILCGVGGYAYIQYRRYPY